MNISFVGSKTFTHAATSAQSVSLTDLKDTAGADATLQENDYIVINYVSSTANVNRSNADMTPSGYTEVISTDLYANDSNDANQLVSYKKMGSTPDTTVSIPASNATTAGVAVTIHAFRGVNLTTPLDVTPTTATGTNTGVADCPSITPVTSGAWIIACGGAGVAAGAVFTNPAGMSGATNHFRSATITSTTTDANVGTALKTDWTSGAFDPAAFGGSTTTNTGSWCATTVVLRPEPAITLTPTNATLSLTTFAPDVLIPQSVTPTIASLALTGFAPTVSLSSDWTLVSDTIPGANRDYTDTGLASSETYEYRLRAIYPTGNSDWSSIAEATTTSGTTVTPATATLTTTAFAPTVSTPVSVTPTTATLTTAAFAPTVSTPVSVTPTTATLATAAFAPTVSTPVSVTPTNATLVTSAFAPAVTAGGNVSVTPAIADLVATSFAPTVTAGGGVSVTPTTATLSLTAFAPTVSTPVSVTPTTATLVTSAFAPAVSTPVSVIPGSATLAITQYAATISTPILVTPAARSLVLTGYSPTLGGATAGYRYYTMMTA